MLIKDLKKLPGIPLEVSGVPKACQADNEENRLNLPRNHRDLLLNFLSRGSASRFFNVAVDVVEVEVDDLSQRRCSRDGGGANWSNVLAVAGRTRLTSHRTSAGLAVGRPGLRVRRMARRLRCLRLRRFLLSVVSGAHVEHN